MNNLTFIKENCHKDTASLALQKTPEGVDIKYCLEQIKSWQKARQKLPHWAEIEGLIFPPTLSMEQCSSQETAEYKRQLLQRLFRDIQPKAMVDLTAGFGVDFSYMAPLFKQAHYVEQQGELCEIARHNFPLLALEGVLVHHTDGVQFLDKLGRVDLIFLDPARRDEHGRKVVFLKDCTPNLELLQDELFLHTQYILVKLSPMLDIHALQQSLKHVREIHVVSVEGECKELLVLMDAQFDGTPSYYAVDFGKNKSIYSVNEKEKQAPILSDGVNIYLYEPNASILKAGIQDTLCHRYAMQKLHMHSHLYTSGQLVDHFPGRGFTLIQQYDFSKPSIKQLCSQVKQANLSIRNFPSSVEELRRRLKIKEGGNYYIFATTLHPNKHVLLLCEKITTPNILNVSMYE